MNGNISEERFEDAIEEALTGGVRTGGDSGFAEEAAVYDAGLHFRARFHTDYNRRLCLVPGDVVDFVQATQPKEWEKLKGHYGESTREKFLQRLSREVSKRGTLDVLRKGIRDAGVHIRMAYFQPPSGLNEDLQHLFRNNVFTMIRQLHYSEQKESSVDVALFLNGLPLFTAELKNHLTGQNVDNGIAQYKRDRDPREPLFAFERCLAHFAVDPDMAYVTTKLEGEKTVFLPFNRGKFGGAGNPPSATGYATAYLWEEVWQPESVLNLVQYFVHSFQEEDEDGKKKGRKMIFPRYQQLEAVRRMVRDAREGGPGRRYLVQHSAGSGKSNSIAWLAHQLSVIHDDSDERVFDSVIVITDRRVLDRQLQQTVRQFEQTQGVVTNIKQDSQQLREALEQGKPIIVTTLQKFPFIAGTIGELPGRRFAIIADEAHSSQSGEATGRSLKAVFAPKNLEEAEQEGEREDAEAQDLDDVLEQQMGQRQFARLNNVSVFAFTATPKQKTLELFGTQRPDGTYEAFSLYSMRQAIEEGFILDVLQNYTTYKEYWRLLKRVEDDPHYDRDKANYLLRSFVDLNALVIEKKVAIMVDHFANHVASRIGQKARAMVVTRSRLHAVRYKRALDRYLEEQGYPFRALVAFSGEVTDPETGLKYTETGMNGFSEAQTARTFAQDPYRIMVVAEKFQTGFDQPLLHTMYVDKKLQGLNAVQTLSRLNRIHPEKHETMVLDFANEAEDVKKAFEPYYEATRLTEGTDPNKLYDVQRRLEDHGVYSDEDIDTVARLLVANKGKEKNVQGKVYAALNVPLERFGALGEEEQADFRGTLNDYIRLYAFLSQLLTFEDASLEKLYLFARYFARTLPPVENELPKEITEAIDLESFRLQQTSSGAITLDRGENELEPMHAEGAHHATEPEEDALSNIIRDLNDRFGTDFTEADKVFIRTLEERLGDDPALRTAVNTNPPENARLTFNLKATDKMQDLVETDFKFYKRVNDDRAFAQHFLDWLFERYRKEAG